MSLSFHFIFCRKLSYLIKGLVCSSAVVCSQKFSWNSWNSWKLERHRDLGSLLRPAPGASGSAYCTRCVVRMCAFGHKHACRCQEELTEVMSSVCIHPCVCMEIHPCMHRGYVHAHLHIQTSERANWNSKIPGCRLLIHVARILLVTQ